MIQQMVTGEVSGVLFTANPKTGRYNECIINANYGLCEGIVSGSCVTDEYVWSPQEIKQIITEKTDQVVFDPQ